MEEAQEDNERVPHPRRPPPLHGALPVRHERHERRPVWLPSVRRTLDRYDADGPDGPESPDAAVAAATDYAVAPVARRDHGRSQPQQQRLSVLTYE